MPRSVSLIAIATNSQMGRPTIAIVNIGPCALEQFAPLSEFALAGWMRLLASQDYVEGPKAFSERRKPVWTGS